MLKPSVQLRLGQSLTMTPQLQQAIRLLQLSTLELQAQIQETLETNPMLEALEGADADLDTGVDEAAAQREEMDSRPDSTDKDAGGREFEEPAEPGGTGDASENIPEELPVDSNWEDLYDMPATGGGQGGDGDGRDLFENQSAPGEDLRDHLLWQINLSPLSERDQVIAMTLIDAINDDGYLGEPIEQIHAGLAQDQELELELDEVEAVLRMVQHLDPVGVGARDLSECLLLQLEQFSPDTAWLAEARTLVRDHLEALGTRDFKGVQRRLGLADGELQAVMALIQSLNPRPGTLISSSSPEYIIPDVFVRKREGYWQVELNPEVAPRLRVNPLYASFVRRADSSQDNVYLRNSLQEARWFIKSLQSRNETLLRVGTAIVEHQRAFLEHGDEAMKPLVLRDIAEQLEMHESTISRVTTQKYMHTPKGIYEFKYFFSSHVGTADGGECSATAIRAMIRKLIAEEPQGKPLSDSKIAQILVDRGIQVARRTVAKYREAMAIPPSNERKRLV
ncbi:RNA polymerase factor sigma-54 [Ectothiorhodospira lacustris]|uniref:RNA polymerase factor sigma-54 n=1 Tax=Ectothiorhodospira lacustris TaxID=2899127 RepID=UPI001EE87E6A|nr:RNA polymerase factor sigma-54 [Ectothiorhodospira lacustris]MCG5500677.1 RNA polymerase factor sigma-54 [Ectothiorhodospira lacustris]MCG5509937.1 RNA polymerase factor sigma-54 [Ectothiorhodospira lacustris]MCG5521191.1 RNA polymerase factor sigma-54 [Ectothiorhodospira lacustris]